MFYGETIFKIRHNNEQDKTRLEIARTTLEEIANVFSKESANCSTEIETLTAAAHILNEIERGEVF